MPTPTDYLKNGALRVIEPAISLLARNRVSPNAITTVGTLVTVAAGGCFSPGPIITAGRGMSGGAGFGAICWGVDRPHYDGRLDHGGDGVLRRHRWRSRPTNGTLHGVRSVL